MWSSYQFFCIVFSILAVLTVQSSSVSKFAVHSEFLWLSVYSLESLAGGFVDAPDIYSMPFIILILTAVEAVIIWVLVVQSFFFNKI
jgi:hypothetical protein